jgi:UrcA family protein
MKTSNTARIHFPFASLIVTGVLLGGSLHPAHAADPGYGVRAKKVSLADLDLSTVAGQTAARERLHQMARRLCDQVEEDLDLSRQPNYVKCVDQAMAQTLPPLDAMIRSSTAIRTAAAGHVQP